MTRLVNKDPKKVDAVIKADPEALALFREAMTFCLDNKKDHRTMPVVFFV